MNRAERRRLSRANKRWLAAVAADPDTTPEELQVARVIAEEARHGAVAFEDDPTRVWALNMPARRRAR